MKSNEIRKIAEKVVNAVLTNTQKTEIKKLLSQNIPHNGFGNFVRDYMMNTQIDYTLLLFYIKRHMPELKQEIDEIFPSPESK